MNWLLDTNVISEPTRRTPSAEVMAWVGAQPITSLYTLSLAMAEIRTGIDQLTDPDRQAELRRWLDQKVRPLFAGRVIEPDEEFWMAAIRILARTKANRRTLPMTDFMFAVAADRHGWVVVTRNVKHFVGAGVRVLDPWAMAPIVRVV